jgi:hypothetical protein
LSKLIEQLRAQRTGRVEVEPGKFLLVRRPLEATEMPRFVRGSATPESFIGQIAGWDGITEADLLGAAVGSSDAAAFTPELAAEVLADRVEWMGKVGEWLVQAITTHLKAREATAKN